MKKGLWMTICSGTAVLGGGLCGLLTLCAEDPSDEDKIAHVECTIFGPQRAAIWRCASRLSSMDSRKSSRRRILTRSRSKKCSSIRIRSPLCCWGRRAAPARAGDRRRSRLRRGAPGGLPDQRAERDQGRPGGLPCVLRDAEPARGGRALPGRPEADVHDRRHRRTENMAQSAQIPMPHLVTVEIIGEDAGRSETDVHLCRRRRRRR